MRSFSWNFVSKICPVKKYSENFQTIINWTKINYIYIELFLSQIIFLFLTTLRDAVIETMLFRVHHYWKKIRGEIKENCWIFEVPKDFWGLLKTFSFSKDRHLRMWRKTHRNVIIYLKKPTNYKMSNHYHYLVKFKYLVWWNFWDLDDTRK